MLVKNISFSVYLKSNTPVNIAKESVIRHTLKRIRAK